MDDFYSLQSHIITFKGELQTTFILEQTKLTVPSFFIPYAFFLQVNEFFKCESPNFPITYSSFKKNRHCLFFDFPPHKLVVVGGWEEWILVINEMIISNILFQFYKWVAIANIYKTAFMCSQSSRTCQLFIHLMLIFYLLFIQQTLFSLDLWARWSG